MPIELLFLFTHLCVALSGDYERPDEVYGKSNKKEKREFFFREDRKDRTYTDLEGVSHPNPNPDLEGVSHSNPDLEGVSHPKPDLEGCLTLTLI